MAKNLITSKVKGFTIIEVVLVLAIAGLIFLMVFVALPAMQRNQRDTARRNDYASFAANITSYITNNNGRLPTTSTPLDPTKYVNNEGADQSGKPYQIQVINCANGSTADADCANKAILTELAPNYANNQIRLILKAKCSKANGEGEQGHVYASTGNRDYAILGQLESGVYCQDNV